MTNFVSPSQWRIYNNPVGGHAGSWFFFFGGGHRFSFVFMFSGGLEGHLPPPPPPLCPSPSYLGFMHA